MILNGNRNVALLSFGEEAEAQEVAVSNVKRSKIKSSHDALENDPTLSKATAIDDRPSTDTGEPSEIIQKASTSNKNVVASKDKSHEDVDNMSGAEYDRMMREKVKRKLDHADGGGDDDDTPKPKERKTDKVDEVRSKVAQMKQDIKELERNREKEKTQVTKTKKEKKVSYVDQEREKYRRLKPKTVQVGNKVVRDETDMMKKLKSFTEMLWQEPEDNEQKEPATFSGEVCALHGVSKCGSCEDRFGDMDEESDEGWLSHKLVFKQEPGTRKDDVDNYEVIDPRQREKEARDVEASKRSAHISKHGVAPAFRNDRRQRELEKDRERNRKAKYR